MNSTANLCCIKVGMFHTQAVQATYSLIKHELITQNIHLELTANNKERKE